MHDSLSPLLDQLQREFHIDDRAGLMEAISAAMWALAKNGPNTPDFREADTLDELAKVLRRARELLTDPINGNRLAEYGWTLATPAFGFVADPLGCAIMLQRLQQAALAAHREREQKTGKLPPRDLRAVVDSLATYWTRDLEREFTQDHRWAASPNHRKEPVTEAERFVFGIVEYLAPDRLGDLPTVLRALRLPPLTDFVKK